MLSKKKKNREWKNHKWIARKRDKNGKWMYDYGNGFPEERELKNQYTGGYTDRYSNNTLGRALKTVSDISKPITKHEIYNNNAAGRVARLNDDVRNVGRAFVNDILKSRRK